MKMKNILRTLSGMLTAASIMICTCSSPIRATEWQVMLEVSNGVGVRDTIRFGVHPDATPGVDSELGEVSQPPWPPSSLFDVRFLTSGPEELKLDLRDTTHTQRFHTVKWQAGEGGYPVTVRWNRSSLPYASLFISDGYGGVFIPPVNMYEADSLQVPSSISYIKQLTIDVTPGVSPGAEPEVDAIPDANIFGGQQFPEICLDDYVFDPDTPDSLIEWFVSGNALLIIEIRDDRMLYIIAPEGWTGTETVTFTAQDPEHHTDQTTATFSVIPGGPPAWTIPVNVQNGASEIRTVHFGIHPDGTDDIDAGLGEVELPPPPLSDAFDARFELPDGYTPSALDIRTSLPGWISYHLLWQEGDGGYPITVSWPGDLPLGEFFIQDDQGGTVIPPTDMSITSQLVVPPEQSSVTGLVIWIDAVVDTINPLGPKNLVYAGSSPGISVSLEWKECIEEHFAYYEILYDTVDFEDDAHFVWDWTEDTALMQKVTTSSTVYLPYPTKDYIFRIRAWDVFGNVGDLSSRVVVSAEDTRHDIAPSDIYLWIWPNPFNGQATIKFSIPKFQSANVLIYDVSGRQIKRYSVKPSGNHTGTVYWDGRDDRGRKVSTGVYFCRLETNQRSVGKKILLLR